MQKRVKISMKKKPQRVEQPLNESIFTPRDPIYSNSNRSQPHSMQPASN